MLRFDFGFLLNFRRFGLGLFDGLASAELRFDQFISVGLNAAVTVLDFEFAFVQKVDDDLRILVEFFSHVKNSVLSRF